MYNDNSYYKTIVTKVSNYKVLQKDPCMTRSKGLLASGKQAETSDL